VPSIERQSLVDCAALLSGDVAELSKASELVKARPKVPIYEETYLNWTQDCDDFRSRRGYVQVNADTGIVTWFRRVPSVLVPSLL